MTTIINLSDITPPPMVEEQLDCSRCGNEIIRDSREHDECHINWQDDIICGDCLESCDCEHCGDGEACWWIRGKGGDKCWGENCGCSEGEDEEEEEQYLKKCDHGCGTILTIDTDIMCWSKGEEEKTLCTSCYYDNDYNEDDDNEDNRYLKLCCGFGTEKQECRDCEIEAKKHCDECGGYGSEDE